MSIGPVNPWAAFTVNSPHGVSLGALPNGGANALLALLVTYEQTGGTRPDVSASIGGQSATLRAVYHVSGATNFNGVDVFIWNAAKIAAMSGSSIALSGANGYPAPSTNNGVQWTWAMLRDVDQAAPTLTPGFKSGNSATTTIDNPAPPASDYSIIAACSSAESNNFTTAPANHSETLDTAAGFHLAGLWEGLGISSGSRVVTQNATSTRICCSQLGFNEDIAASPPVLATITQNPQEGDTITTTGSNLQSAVLELDGVEQTPIDNSGGSGGTYTCVLGDNRYDVALDAEVTTGAGTDTLEDEVTIAPPDNSQLLLTVAPLADPAERIPGVTAAGQQVLLYDPTGDFEDIPGDVTGYTNGAFSTIAGDGTFKSKVHGSVWSTPETNTVEDPPVEAPPTFDGPDIDDVRYELGEAITPLDLSGRFSDAGEFGLFRLGATLGSSLATGAGAASTALVLEDGTDFDPGRYVIIGTGFPIAITARDGNAVTLLLPATWSDDTAVTLVDAQPLTISGLTFLDGELAGEPDVFASTSDCFIRGTNGNGFADSDRFRVIVFVPMPDVMGETQDDALDLIDATGISNVLRRRRVSLDTPGTVIEQSPAADDEVEADDTVEIVVARAATEAAGTVRTLRARGGMRVR